MDKKRHSQQQYIQECKIIIAKHLAYYLYMHYTHKKYGFTESEQLILKIINYAQSTYLLSYDETLWYLGDKKEGYNKADEVLTRYLEEYTIYKRFVMPVLKLRLQCRQTWHNNSTLSLSSLYEHHAYGEWEHQVQLLKEYYNRLHPKESEQIA